MSPAATLIYVQNFFAWITGEALHGRPGVVDKYIGDEVMVVFSTEFGSQNPLPDAIQAAAAMSRRDALAYCPHIGIASGHVIVGYAGTPLRYDVSVFGAPVALAARCAAVKPEAGAEKANFSSSITSPEAEWAERELDDVLPPLTRTKPDGSTYLDYQTFELQRSRAVRMKGLGDVEVRQILNSGLWFPSQSAEDRALESLRVLYDNNRYWPRWEEPPRAARPQRLAPGPVPRLRWSPIRGCELPQTAMIRARALAAGTGRGVDGGDFWQAQTESVLRALLHAAALDARPPAQLYRWSLSPAASGQAVQVLTNASGAADGWAEGLDDAINADPRTRDSIWVGVRTALSCLADPRVLDAVTPGDGEQFDPAEFLRDRGALYLLGTSSGAGAAANLIGAWLEDIVEAGRSLAAAAPGARLDPPVALILDEVANYPLPSLPELMSEGGGSGITTVAVLQSLEQARAKWVNTKAARSGTPRSSRSSLVAVPTPATSPTCPR